MIAPGKEKKAFFTIRRRTERWAGRNSLKPKILSFFISKTFWETAKIWETGGGGTLKVPRSLIDARRRLSSSKNVGFGFERKEENFHIPTKEKRGEQQHVSSLLLPAKRREALHVALGFGVARSRRRRL